MACLLPLHLYRNLISLIQHSRITKALLLPHPGQGPGPGQKCIDLSHIVYLGLDLVEDGSSLHNSTAHMEVMQEMTWRP